MATVCCTDIVQEAVGVPLRTAGPVLHESLRGTPTYTGLNLQ